jgi:hypothetical protein
MNKKIKPKNKNSSFWQVRFGLQEKDGTGKMKPKGIRLTGKLKPYNRKERFLRCLRNIAGKIRQTGMSVTDKKFTQLKI